MTQYATKDKRDYKDIVVEHLHSISDKSLKEFRGGYFEKKINGSFVEETYIPDSRKEYIQSIEFFSDLLRPFFEVELTEKDLVDDEDEDVINQLETKNKHKKIMKKHYDRIENDIKQLLNKLEKAEIDKEEYTIQKTRLMRELFQKLLIFCERIKLFGKKSVYG